MKTHSSPLSSSKGQNTILLASVLLVITMTGCAQLYKVNTVERVNAFDTLEVLKKNNKRFIIHLKDTSFVLANPSIKETEVEGILFPLNDMQLKYLHPKSKSKNIFLKADGEEVLNQVHLYATTNSVSNTTNFSILFSTMTKLDIYEKNLKATKRSHIVGNIILVVTIIAATLGAATLALIDMMSKLG